MFKVWTEMEDMPISTGEWYFTSRANAQDKCYELYKAGENPQMKEISIEDSSSIGSLKARRALSEVLVALEKLARETGVSRVDLLTAKLDAKAAERAQSATVQETN